jgi:hypothetical protein
MLKHKKLFIATIAVVALTAAIALAGVAFGWWTASATNGTGNTVSTGTAGLAMSSNVLNLSGLQPVVTPADYTVPVTGAVTDYVYVENTGSTPLVFYAYLSDPSDAGGIVPYLETNIQLDPATNPYGWTDTFQTGGPYTVYAGPLSTIWDSSAQGQYYLASVAPPLPSTTATPIMPGQVGVYKIAVWLDSSAPNSTQAQTATFSINFSGITLAEWTANGNHF